MSAKGHLSRNLYYRYRSPPMAEVAPRNLIHLPATGTAHVHALDTSTLVQQQHNTDETFVFLSHLRTLFTPGVVRLLISQFYYFEACKRRGIQQVVPLQTPSYCEWLVTGDSDSSLPVYCVITPDLGVSPN
jgi:hypothetical protein